MVPGTPPPPEIASTQNPLTTHFMKQGMGERARFDPFLAKNKQPEVAPARQIYGQMNKDIEATTPGYAARNKDIQGLIGLRDRSHAAELGPGTGSDIFNRVRARTGAMLPTLAAGSVGGAPAAALTLGAQGLMNSPRTLIGAARAMYGTGRRLPLAAALGKGGPLFRLNEGEQ